MGGVLTAKERKERKEEDELFFPTLQNSAFFIHPYPSAPFAVPSRRKLDVLLLRRDKTSGVRTAKELRVGLSEEYSLRIDIFNLWIEFFIFYFPTSFKPDPLDLICN